MVATMKTNLAYRPYLTTQSALRIGNNQITREQNLQMQASARIYQQRYDDVLQPWGVRAPAPTLGQDIDKYTRDLAVKAKSLLPDNHQLKKVQYRGLPSDAFEGYEPQLLRAVRTVATDNSTVPMINR